MPVTPVFGWPYQHRLEQPGLNPEAIERLALAIEATLVTSVISRMGCSLNRVANQTLPDAALTSVSWDTELADTDGLWTSGTNIVIPANGAGVWAVYANVFIAAALAGIGQTRINVNGVEQSRAVFADTGSSVGIVTPIAAGGVVTVQAFADTAAGTTMTANVVCYRVGA